MTPLDPVVSRTRAARRALMERFDFDLDKVCEYFRSLEAQHPERVVDLSRVNGSSNGKRVKSPASEPIRHKNP